MIILATLLGGMVGVLLRMLLDRLCPHEELLQWETLAWTVFGAFALGIVTGVTLPWLQAGGPCAGVHIALSGLCSSTV